jgi:hypothetical protein
LKFGRGRGPGEFQNLTDFDIATDKIWAVDIQNLKILQFSLESGELLEEVSVNRRPLRITCLSEGFIIQWFGSDLLFSKFDYRGNELFEFGNIIENQQSHVMSLTGFIRSNRENNFVYIPNYSSLIYHYNHEGELINIVKTPDGLEFPITRKEGPRSLVTDFAYMRDGWFDENFQLYVYTRLRKEDGEKGYSVIDKFDLTEAKYIESAKVFFKHSAAIYSLQSAESVYKHMIKNDFQF